MFIVFVYILPGDRIRIVLFGEEFSTSRELSTLPAIETSPPWCFQVKALLMYKDWLNAIFVFI